MKYTGTRILYAGALAAAMAAMPLNAQAYSLDQGLEAAAQGHYGVAKDHFSPLAEEGDAQAQYSLGVMHNEGLGVHENAPLAAEFFEASAAQGYAQAQHNLGLMLMIGRGVDQDRGRAAELFEKASNQGLAEAQQNLGLMYFTGIGAEKDRSHAASLLYKAAEKGSSLAQHQLAIMFKMGQGVTPSNVLAYVMSSLAVESGGMDSNSLMKNLKSSLSEVEVFEGEKIKQDWLEGRRSDFVATINLGSTGKT